MINYYDSIIGGFDFHVISDCDSLYEIISTREDFNSIEEYICKEVNPKLPELRFEYYDGCENKDKDKEPILSSYHYIHSLLLHAKAAIKKSIDFTWEYGINDRVEKKNQLPVNELIKSLYLPFHHPEEVIRFRESFENKPFEKYLQWNLYHTTDHDSNIKILKRFLNLYVKKLVNDYVSFEVNERQDRVARVGIHKLSSYELLTNHQFDFDDNTPYGVFSTDTIRVVSQFFFIMQYCVQFIFEELEYQIHEFDKFIEQNATHKVVELPIMTVMDMGFVIANDFLFYAIKQLTTLRKESANSDKTM